ncbi:MAG: hypothetical protein ACFB15_01965 [Cyclobacteriaceae bacterium]
MYRIINSLASAEYNKELGAVEINFNGYGEPTLYHETMDIAMNIAAIYDTNKWLFIKDFFQDINPHQFLFFVKKWSKTSNELLSPLSDHETCKVALLTSLASREKLVSDNEWLKQSKAKFSNLDFRVFFKQENAQEFLTHKEVEQLASLKD